MVHFQNYILPGESDWGPVTIVEAACATLSSARIFEPVEFGRPASKYVAGELGANNPIDRVWTEAQRVWRKPDRFDDLVSCVVSVGAGRSRLRSVQADDAGFTQALYDIATQTDETETKFYSEKQELLGKDKRYHRFNVNNLRDLGWERYDAAGEVRDDARFYLKGMTSEIGQCAEQLSRESFVPSNGKNQDNPEME